jgi:hypothetical protein
MIRLFLIIITLLIASCNSNNMLTEVKILPNYPSASGIEYFDNKLYITGDDANQMLVTDSSFNNIDSIPLYFTAEKRISKAVKADLEAITLVSDDGETKLLLLGSGSLSPYRNTGWLVNPVNKHTVNIQLDTFYQRLKAHGLDEINIEGACSIPGNIILSNRGNKNYPKNFLAITKKEFWKNQSEAPIALIRIGVNTDTAVFNGISGIAYAEKTDQLILTVSTEDTRNSMDDGAIGKSYLWIVNDFSTKKKWKAINPNKIIDLGKKDNHFKGQKIESVCIVNDSKNALQLVLAADNDNGSSTLFRIELEKD